MINLIKFIQNELFSIFKNNSNNTNVKYCFVKLKQADQYHKLYKHEQKRGRYYD